MADVIGADPPQLIAGGVDLTRVTDMVNEMLKELEWTAASFSFSAGGGDYLSKLLVEQYKPSEEYCIQFLRMLRDLLNNHGENVIGAGQTLGTANEIATTVASGGRR